MACGRTRTDVELVEDDEGDGPVAPGAPATPTEAPHPSGRGRRRALVLAATVVVALTVVATVGQLRQAGAERDRLARVAALPHTVASLAVPPRPRWSPDDDVLQVTARTPDGGLVRTLDDPDGSSRAQALDPATGDVVWERELLPPATPPEGWTPVGGWCTGLGDDHARLACWASDATYRFEQDELRYEAATTVRLLLLDARDGTVAVDASDAVAGVDTRASVEVLGDLVVVADVDGEEALLLAVGLDGRVVWRRTVPAPVPAPSGSGRTEPFADLLPLGEHLLVATADTAHLLDRTGATLRTFPLGPDEYVNGVVDGAALVRTGPTATGLGRVDGEVVLQGEGIRVLALDGEHVLRGAGMAVEVDDASVPGLVLTSDHEGVHAWGLDGELRWTADPGGRPLSAAVLDGRVHVLAHRTVVTLDARTGAELWRREEVAATQPVVTDGRRLLLRSETDTGEATDLLALDAADGGLLWRAPAPDGLDLLRAVHGVLVGESYSTGGIDEWSTTVLG